MSHNAHTCGAVVVAGTTGGRTGHPIAPAVGTDWTFQTGSRGRPGILTGDALSRGRSIGARTGEADRTVATRGGATSTVSTHTAALTKEH